MRELYPSFANPRTWRSLSQTKILEGEAWKEIRLKTLLRDNYTCQYCGYQSPKYQIVDHIDGNPENNDDSNLQTVCQMCNLVKHSGQGCVVQGVVDLFKESKYNQNDIIKITRQMRDEGKTDQEIIQFLGLKHKMPFEMDLEYLKSLFAFVTSRPTKNRDKMYDRWKAYHESSLKENL